MMFQFDSSAILNITRHYGREARKMLMDNLTPPHARYEIGNALRKETILLK